MTVRPKTHVQLKTEAGGPSQSLATVSIRDLRFATGEFVACGDTSPEPMDTALAALARDPDMIGQKRAAKPGGGIRHPGISLTRDLDRRGVTQADVIALAFVVPAFGSIDRIVTVSGRGSAAEKHKPLARFLAGAGTQLRTPWIKA